jgi:hypothetical protein
MLMCKETNKIWDKIVLILNPRQLEIGMFLVLNFVSDPEILVNESGQILYSPARIFTS